MAARRRRVLENGRWAATLAFPILVSHQTEEWVWPGGFLPFCNEELLGSDQPTWPLTERIGFHVNVTYGWGTALAGALLWETAPGVAAAVVLVEVGNVGMHVGMAVRARRYNPGLATAALLMAPHAAAGARHLLRSGRLTRRGVATAAAIGLAFEALPVAMKLRLRR